jgi:hypothetical protein
MDRPVLSRRGLAIALAALAALAVPGLVAAQNPLASPEVYALFLEWLEGKSKALVTFRVSAVDGEERPVSDRFTVYVHNFTEYWRKPSSERVYAGPLQPIPLRIWRLLNRFNEWVEHEYTIVLVGARYFGAKLVRVKPEKPLLTVDVEVPVSEVKAPAGGRIGCALPGARASSSASSACVPCSGPPYHDVRETSQLTNAIQLHTIPGVEAYISFKIGNYLYFDQRYRSLWLYYDYNAGTCCFEPATDWQTSGSKPAMCGNDVNTGSLADGAKRWVKVGVTYRYELWLAEQAPAYYYYELLTPVDFGGASWGDDISCSLCGGKPTGGTYPYARGTPTPITIRLGPGIDQVEAWGADVTVQVIYGPVTVTVHVWYKVDRGEAGEPPKLVISRVNWQADNLYAFDAGTGWKVVHFTWTPP